MPAITPDPKVPTRQQLSKFLPDYETVKLFEKLFSQVGVTTPSTLEDIGIEAGTARATSQQAIDSLDRLLALVELLIFDNKAQQALDTLERIANSIGLAETDQIVQLEETQSDKSMRVLAWLTM